MLRRIQGWLRDLRLRRDCRARHIAKRAVGYITTHPYESETMYYHVFDCDHCGGRNIRQHVYCLELDKGLPWVGNYEAYKYYSGRLEPRDVCSCGGDMASGRTVCLKCETRPSR